MSLSHHPRRPCFRYIQVEDAEEAQQFGEDPIQPVEAQIVEEAPKAIVANGDGDVATTGEGEMQHAWAKVPAF